MTDSIIITVLNKTLINQSMGGLHLGDMDLTNYFFAFAVGLPIIYSIARTFGRTIFKGLSRWSEGRVSNKYDVKTIKTSRFIVLLKVLGLVKTKGKAKKK